MSLMRLTWGKIKPGKWDEYERLWNAYAAETAGTEGLQARWLVRDTENGDAGYSVAIWSTEANFLKYHEKTDTRNDEAIKACFQGEYTTTMCEVRGEHVDALRQQSKSG